MQTVCVRTRHCYMENQSRPHRVLRLREHYCCGIGRTSWAILASASRLEA
jgi:hypothetical protein